MTAEEPCAAPRIPPIPAVDAEALRRLGAQLDAVGAEVRRFLEVMAPLLDAHLAELRRALRTGAELARTVEQAGRVPDRPAWQSVHGPRHRRRARR